MSREDVEPGILLVGAGGVGTPAAWALAEAGARRITVVDGDTVALSNLHRQVLFEDADLGRPKVDVLGEALSREGFLLELDVVRARVHPEDAAPLVSRASVVIDATDNFASRFLLADAARLAGVPIVHAAAVRWQATVFAVGAQGRPCYRCLFEDLPSGASLDCATAGVAGPLCGVAGALAADRALRILEGDATATGRIVTFDGLEDRLREIEVHPRHDCVLCGPARSIGSLDASRYTEADACS